MNAAKVGVAVAVIVLGGLLWRSAAETGGPAPAPDGFAIRDVRVFDGERFVDGMTVRVRDGLIADVGADVALPAGMDAIDGRGRTLLPGLIDGHVHTWGDARRDALRFGVTTMLDMFSDPAQLPDARREREDPASPAVAADLYSAGLLATADGGHGTQFGIAVPVLRAPADAGAWVDARVAEGSDWIKLVREDLHVYDTDRALPTLDAATAAAVIAAAHARGRRALVHASAQEHARESLRDGADGLVHVFQDAPADAAFVALARERGAFVVPTLSVIAAFAGRPQTLTDDPRLRGWLSPVQSQSLGGARPFGDTAAVLFDNALESVRRLHAAGVPIIAGTDAIRPRRPRCRRARSVSPTAAGSRRGCAPIWCSSKAIPATTSRRPARSSACGRTAGPSIAASSPRTCRRSRRAWSATSTANASTAGSAAAGWRRATGWPAARPTRRSRASTGVPATVPARCASPGRYGRARRSAGPGRS